MAKRRALSYLQLLTTLFLAWGCYPCQAQPNPADSIPDQPELVKVVPALPGTMPLADVTLEFGTGDQRIVLHTDAQGRLFLTIDDQVKNVGTIDSSGRLDAGPNKPGLGLDIEGYIVGDGEVTPLLLDPLGTVILANKTVFKVEHGALIPLETFADIGPRLKDVKITASEGSDRLVAYLLIAYLLLV